MKNLLKVKPLIQKHQLKNGKGTGKLTILFTPEQMAAIEANMLNTVPGTNVNSNRTVGETARRAGVEATRTRLRTNYKRDKRRNVGEMHTYVASKERQDPITGEPIITETVDVGSNGSGAMSGRDPLLGTIFDLYTGTKAWNSGAKLLLWGAGKYMPSTMLGLWGRTGIINDVARRSFNPGGWGQVVARPIEKTSIQKGFSFNDLPQEKYIYNNRTGDFDVVAPKKEWIQKGENELVPDYFMSPLEKERLIATGISPEEALEIMDVRWLNSIEALPGKLRNLGERTFGDTQNIDGRAFVRYNSRKGVKASLNNVITTLNTVFHELGGHGSSLNIGYGTQTIPINMKDILMKIYKHNESLRPLLKPFYQAIKDGDFDLAKNLAKDEGIELSSLKGTSGDVNFEGLRNFIKYMEENQEYSARAIGSNMSNHYGMPNGWNEQQLRLFFTDESVNKLLKNVWNYNIPIIAGGYTLYNTFNGPYQQSQIKKQGGKMFKFKKGNKIYIKKYQNPSGPLKPAQVYLNGKWVNLESHGDGNLSAGGRLFKVKTKPTSATGNNEVVITPKGATSLPVTKDEGYKSEYRSAYHPEDAISFINTLTLGGLHNLSPTLWVRRAYDTKELLSGNMDWSDYTNSWINGNNGIVSDLFAGEHPYWSTGINLVGDGIGLGKIASGLSKTPGVYYHGSPVSGLKSLENPTNGIFLASTRGSAKRYGGMFEGTGSLYKVENVSLGDKPLEVNGYFLPNGLIPSKQLPEDVLSRLGVKGSTDAISRAALDAGYSSVTFKNVLDGSRLLGWRSFTPTWMDLTVVFNKLTPVSETKRFFTELGENTLTKGRVKDMVNNTSKQLTALPVLGLEKASTLYNRKQGGKLDFLKKGNKIHIKKANRGKFTDYCGGEVTNECILRGKHSSNPAVRKRATFAANARKWKHKEGGVVKADNGIKFTLNDGLALGSLLIGNAVNSIQQNKFIDSQIKANKVLNKYLQSQIWNNSLSKAREDYYTKLFKINQKEPNSGEFINESPTVAEHSVWDMASKDANNLINNLNNQTLLDNLQLQQQKKSILGSSLGIAGNFIMNKFNNVLRS